MPQTAIALPAVSRHDASPNDAKRCASTSGWTDSAENTHRIETSPGLFSRLYRSLFDSRRIAVVGNGLGDLDHLPAELCQQVLSYITDPFERATLLRTCKAMRRLMAPYKGEFALFRSVIAVKKSLEPHAKSDFTRGVDSWMDLLSGSRWSDGTRRRALRDVVRRLIAMQPHVPQRIFHEAFPLFKSLQPRAQLESCREIFGLLKDGPPQLMILVLAEFAWRTTLGRIPEVDEQLFKRAVALWTNPQTHEAAEHAIASIVMRYSSDLRHEDCRRWRQALSLLPATATVESESVLGLAAYARQLEGGRWLEGGLTEALTRRVGFPEPEAIAAFQRRFASMHGVECRIDGARLRRQEASIAYQKYMRKDSDAAAYEPPLLGYS